MRCLFTVPGKVVSINATYKRGRGNRFYKSAEAEEFFSRIQLFARQAMARYHPREDSVGVQIDLYLANLRQDIDSGLKTTLDALQGICFVRDSQVRALALRKHHDPEHPRMNIEVYSLETP